MYREEEGVWLSKGGGTAIKRGDTAIKKGGTRSGSLDICQIEYIYSTNVKAKQEIKKC